MRKFRNRCAVCGQKFEPSDPHIEFHHVNGNCEETKINNLIPVCGNCHKRIHDLAGSKLQDYKYRKEKERSRETFDLFDPWKEGKRITDFILDSASSINENIWGITNRRRRR